MCAEMVRRLASSFIVQECLSDNIFYTADPKEMEFILTDDHSYPDDYPEEGEQITVVGVFDTYMEGDYTYCILTNAKLDL